MQLLYDTLKKLIGLHEELIQISNHKTVEIKQGDMDKLYKLLMLERKQIQAITQTETKRQSIVDDFFANIGALNIEYSMFNLLFIICFFILYKSILYK